MKQCKQQLIGQVYNKLPTVKADSMTVTQQSKDGKSPTSVGTVNHTSGQDGASKMSNGSKGRGNGNDIGEVEPAGQAKAPQDAAIVSTAQAACAMPKSNESSSAALQKDTYASTKQSLAFLQAKQDLADGDFERALATIESALTSAMTRVGNDELHEALAPLNYLYGTTLLYSIEESNDLSGGAGNAEAAGDVDDVDANGDEEPPPATEDAANLSTDVAEDMQIAWENLETARSILNRLVGATNLEVDCIVHLHSTDATDQALDLAQIHLRLGDLQRANGNYANSVKDYHRCLDLRIQVYPGGYHRSVADCHFALATTYLLYAAEAEKRRQQEEAAENDEATAARETVSHPNVVAAASAASSTPTHQTESVITEDEINDAKVHAVRHYVECGKSIGGLIGNLCGDDADAIAALASEASCDMDKKQPAAAASGNLNVAVPTKSESVTFTNSGNGNNTSSTTPSNIAIISSDALQAIRQRVSELTPMDEQDGDTVNDLKELLNEIKETIDSSDESVRVVKDVAQIKIDIEANVEAEDNAALDAGLNENQMSAVSGAETTQSTTSVGFGNSSGSAAIVVGATNSNDAGTVNVMVAKKKKRNPSKQEEVGNDDDRKKTKLV